MNSLFDLVPDKFNDSDILDKISKPPEKAKLKLSGTTSLFGRISSIINLVESVFGDRKDEFICIRNTIDFVNYIDKIIENGACAIDTETTSLEPITTTLAGICLYTPNMKPCYIPINHISYITQEKIENQLSEDIVKEQLIRLINNDVKFHLFAAKFDYRVIKNTLGIKLPIYWCGYTAQRLLNENEKVNKLKALHEKFIKKSNSVSFSYDDLFKGIPFTYIPINTATPYAANDAIITWELNHWQMQYLSLDNLLKPDLIPIAEYYKEVEIPLISVVGDMEDYGIGLDTEMQAKLLSEYLPKLEERKKEFTKQLEPYLDKIEHYKKVTYDHKLKDPEINPLSVEQVKELLFKVLGYKQPLIKNQLGKYVPSDKVDKKTLEKIDSDIAKSILKIREFNKLINTYLEKMGNVVNPKTGRIHAQFNPLGTRTGRFSSNEPNLQNIPSKAKDIRKVFIPKVGNVFMSCDYTAQEMRLCAHISNETSMIKAFLNDMKIYEFCASKVYDVPYEDCFEKFPDGSINYEGKQRRANVKAIVLGVLYSKGISMIAEDLNVSYDKAKELYNLVFDTFPTLRDFIDNGIKEAKELGYVTTISGRKCRLPELKLSKYEFDFDDTKVSHATIMKYYNQLNNKYLRFNDKLQIIENAKADGIKIIDNSGTIAEYERKVANSKIQGSAAEQIKRAMIAVHNDKICNELGVHIVACIHDELLVEFPETNIDLASKRVKQIMEDTLSDVLKVPSKCDIEISYRWNGDKINVT